MSCLQRPDSFADEDDGRGHEENPQPFVPLEGNNVKHLTAQLYDENLTDEDQQDDEQESATTSEMESAAMRQECAGVEQVPELKHHEGGEEQAQLEVREFAVYPLLTTINEQTDKVADVLDLSMLEHPQQTCHDDKEESSDAEDELPHRRGNDELAAVTRPLAHDG